MKTILYLGTDPAHLENTGRLIHYPVIKIVPRPLDHPELKQAFDDIDAYTHFIFTSKNAVKVFFDHLTSLNKMVNQKQIIAIGSVTASHLSAHGCPATDVSPEETQEGVVKLLSTMDLDDAYFFLPRSSLSRPILANFFKEREVRYQACDLYDTVSHGVNPKPDLDLMDEIIFTSPSTVQGFLDVFGALPQRKKCIAIGPITEQALLNFFKGDL